MEPDSLLDQDDSYGKRGAGKVAELGIQPLLRQTFLCLLQESELKRGGGQAAGHCLVLGARVRGPGAAGSREWSLGQTLGLWALAGVVVGGGEGEGDSAASVLLLAKKERKEVCRPPAFRPHPLSPGLLGAVGNLISEILQINIDGPATGMFPVIKAG